MQRTCDEIGIPYAREAWGTGFRSTKESEYLALNPNALVPVIKDGELGRNCGSVGGDFRTVVPALLHFDFMQPARR